jgi:hypothetical protein
MHRATWRGDLCDVTIRTARWCQDGDCIAIANRALLRPSVELVNTAPAEVEHSIGPIEVVADERATDPSHRRWRQYLGRHWQGHVVLVDRMMEWPMSGCRSRGHGDRPDTRA